MMHEEETRSLLSRPAREPDGARPSFLVSVVAGPDRGFAFELDGAASPRCFAGVGPACALRLTDPLVSRRHAAFEIETEGLRVQDLGSKNGTVVNGLRIADALLAGGEVVRIGATMLKVERLARVATARQTRAMAFGRVIGASAEMRRLYPLFQAIAAAAAPALIEGETGTGKELLAEVLHETGPRALGPFVVADCGDDGGASLASSIEQARGGTLFVDDVAELDARAQRILIEVIDRGGGDPRIVVATRTDLDAEVQAGRFRDDLLRRLAGLRAELPPLRRRKGDVALLARHFWRTLGGGDQMPPDLVARLETYAWPGNVRELANFVARRFARGAAEPVLEDDDDDMDRFLDMPFTRARAAAQADFEKRYVTRVLARHGGHVGRAAAASGIARRYFQVIRGRSSGGRT
jgi:DNA-binding NtrC family response regulator